MLTQNTIIKSKSDLIVEDQDVECLEMSEDLCSDHYTVTPEIGIGALPPLCKVEAGFNWLASKLTIISSILLVLITLFITIDVAGRLLFNSPWRGITDLEMLFMSIVGFTSLAIPIVQRQSLQIDMLYERLPSKSQRALYLFSSATGTWVGVLLGYRACLSAMKWHRETGILEIAEWPVMMITGICLILAGIGFLFQTMQILKVLWKNKEYGTIVFALLVAIGLTTLPFIYKAVGIKVSGLVLGGIGFSILMIIMLLRVPLGIAMTAVGILGLLAVTRTPSAALNSVAVIPFQHTATFMMIAFPMFMLMGEMVSLAGLSDDLFNAAEKWFGRAPGGLAVATVGGCAGFGAICGDSMATVITMTSVAMPAMESNGYDQGLSAGTLAAGGTLGILIPPSMGFIIYSMITEESVGALFLAGIIPGILLSLIFIAIIVIKVKLNPSLAPKSPSYPLSVKLFSLIYLIPVVILFLIVVMGILKGWFTPAEGGAVGTVLAFFYALARKKITWKKFKHTMFHTSAMFGKLFILFVGLYVLGGFLAVSRLPHLLATSVAEMNVNPYVVLMAIIFLYIILGCVMNIMPMMMLTLPSIYPTVQALGFDGIWFGVLCVLVMEMGMITPPVGMNVFTLAGLRPDIPTLTIFKGVMPFFFGMLLCVALIVIFPQIALFL